MVPPTSKSEAKALEDTATSTLLLLRNFNAAIYPNSPLQNPSSQISADSLEPLELIYTSAKLLKAHTTKLSLLIMNKPFTPSAIRKVISELSGTCLPALASGVEICSPTRYGLVMIEEVKARVRRVFRELESMMQEVLSQSKTLTEQNCEPEGNMRSSKVETVAREVLPSTGVTWQACDDLMELQQNGVAGVVVRKAQQHHDMLKDAIDELKEWGEEEEDEEDDEYEDEDNDALEGSDSGHSIEKLLAGTQKLPRDRLDLRASLNSSLKTLRLVSSLYQAVIKRRLKNVSTIYATPSVEGTLNLSSKQASLERLDQVMERLKTIPDAVDEVANALYELDIEEVQRSLAEVQSMAKEVIAYSSLNWSGQEDEYTKWTTKWIEAVN